MRFPVVYRWCGNRVAVYSGLLPSYQQLTGDADAK